MSSLWKGISEPKWPISLGPVNREGSVRQYVQVGESKHFLSGTENVQNQRVPIHFLPIERLQTPFSLLYTYM